MKSLLLRINASLSSTRAGLTAFAALGLLTTAMIGFAELPIARPNDPVVFTTPPPVQTLGSGEIKLSPRLSQTKLVQGGDGVIYLNLDIEAPPSLAGIGPRAATDLIIVLDRSGSMAAENRLPFAKQAVSDLLHRLTPEDQFALVAFDSAASVFADLAAVTPGERERLIGVVNLVQPGSGTNMSEALLQARALALRGGSDRRRKLLLLSDGQANEGITDPVELGALARGLNKNGVILSTIGMGLGFNEMLMAALADHGMGSYAYLEHLGGLGEILARNLSDSRSIYARGSEIEIELSPGITLADAGGYPVSQVAPGVVRLPTGQILSGAKRRLTLTFNTSTESSREFSLGSLRLRYQTDTGRAEVRLGSEQFMLAVLPRERRAEVLASVNQPLVKESWLSNNLGRLKAAYRDAIASGDKKKAQASIDGYHGEARKAESELGIAIVDAETKSDLAAMEEDLNDAFAGATAEQGVKQNRLAKKAHAQGLAAQRSK